MPRQTWPSLGHWSDIEPTYNGDMKETQPFGVQVIKKLGHVVVLVTAPCGQLHVEVCWSLYEDLTAVNDGIRARNNILKRQEVRYQQFAEQLASSLFPSSGGTGNIFKYGSIMRK